MGDLGISIYPSKSSLDEMKDYVFLAARLGYRRIFTSYVLFLITFTNTSTGRLGWIRKFK